MAMAARAPDPVLAKFRNALQQVYGPRIERVVLFGSRARWCPFVRVCSWLLIPRSPVVVSGICWYLPVAGRCSLAPTVCVPL